MVQIRVRVGILKPHVGFDMSGPSEWDAGLKAMGPKAMVPIRINGPQFPTTNRSKTWYFSSRGRLNSPAGKVGHCEYHGF